MRNAEPEWAGDRFHQSGNRTLFRIQKACRTQEDLQKADAARRAIDINSQVPDYYYVMGLVLRELGEQKESEEALAKYSLLRQHTDVLPEYKSQKPLSLSDPCLGERPAIELGRCVFPLMN